MRFFLLMLLISMSFMAIGQTPFKGSDYIYYYQVGVGKTNGSLTHPSSYLEVGKDSSTRAMLIPRVVDTADIPSPKYGLLLYQIKDNYVYYRDKFGYRRVSDGSGYLKISDSTIYYPYWSNPRNYLSAESDPVANAKTIRWIAGTGINVSNGTAQALSTNPVATISAQNTTALWNANQIQGIPVIGTAPTTGQVLQYNGSQYIPFTPPPAGTVTSVGLSLPPIFNVTGSPVTSSGILTGSFVNQLANLVFASPNGVSGPPSFRSLANSDFPINGVSPGTYGSDTTSVRATVDNKGLITNIQSIPIAVSWDSIRRKPNSGNYIYNNFSTTQSSANFNISGSGVLNKIFTNAGTGSSSQSHLLMRNNSLDRITMGLTGVEAGSNSGSDLIYNRFDDVGVFLGNLLYGRRSDGFVGIGTTSPAYKLSVQNGITYSDGYGAAIVNKSTSSTASLTSETVLNIITNGVTVTIPNAAPSNYGKIYSIIKDFNGGRGYVASNNIDGLTTYELGDTIKGVTIISDGAAWKVTGTKNLLTNVTSSAPRTLTTFFTDASNSSSGTFSQLYGYSIPSNTLTSNGQYIIAEYGGAFAANANTKGLQMFVNGTGSSSSDQAAYSGERWSVRVAFIRTGTTTGRLTVDFGRMNSAYVEITGLNYTAPISFGLWGLGGASGDVTAGMGIITFYP